MSKINYKRIFLGFFVILLAFVLVGCSSEKKDNTIEEDKGSDTLATEESMSMNSVEKIDAVENKLSMGEKATLEVYSDFQCPACAGAASAVENIKTKYADKLKVEFVNYPLMSIHPQAFKAAEAAECARDQEFFWEYHDTLFEKQSEWSKNERSLELFKEYAVEVGVEEEEFVSCLDNKEKEALVMSGVQAAQDLGLRGTPSFVLEGEKLDGFRTWEELELLINKIIN